MQEVLFQYCISHVSDEPRTNSEIASDCTQIYLVDGQQLEFDRAVLAAGGVSYAADMALLLRSNAKGQDSIHFQQLRAFILAQQLLETHPSHAARKLRVAVIGAGFAGLTAAIAMLERGGGNVEVTLFEHHRDIMPRFAGAYGRRVHPYHHLRDPRDATRDESSWPCPLEGGDRLERGGIDGILSWTPGPIEKVVDEVRKAARIKLDAFRAAGLLDLRLQCKVTSIEAAGDTSCTLTSIDYRSVAVGSKRMTTLDEMSTEQGVQDTFDIVILAAGGGRDTVSLTGQSNTEYWTPSRVMNAPPLPERYEVAIIGAGNSAASEVFNYLLPNHSFVHLLSKLQSWRNHPRIGSHIEKLFELKFHGELVERKFVDWLTLQAWEEICSVVEEELVAPGELYSSEMIGITLLVRNSTPIFDEMNAVNKFLVLFLAAIRHVRIVNVYDDLGVDRKHGLGATYRIKVKNRTVELWLPKGKKMKPLKGGAWSAVCNCSGVAKSYQNVFKSLEARKARGFPYRLSGTDEKLFTLREVLVAKQAIIEGAREQPVTANAAAGSSAA